MDKPLTHAAIVIAILSFTLTFAPPPQESTDSRAQMLIDADHFRLDLQVPSSREAWDQRRETMRAKILLDTGLWPEPARTPLNAKIFGEVEGDGFTVAKVYFESLPGFLVTGNLYRPLGTGPFPAVLTPHGHWQYGRLQNGPAGSIPGRCIDLARQGYVVFSLDMIGYGDSRQFPHDWAKSQAQLSADQPLPYEPRLFRGDFNFPEAQFHGLSLGGLQLWNSIRSLDFLAELPGVDSNRLAVTGASGGATQSLLLMAVDDRVRVAAPVNIIGAEKHPGCLCENVPGLWIGASTVEIAAAFAPKPLLLMSATEDPWTHSTPARELPMIRQFYALYGAEDRVHNVHVSAGHNYNLDTRKAVYDWFRQHLDPPYDPVAPIEDGSPVVAALGDLRVFPDHVLPDNARGWKAIVNDWVAASRSEWEDRLGNRGETVRQALPELQRALSLVLKVEKPASETLVYAKNVEERRGPFLYTSESIGRDGRGDWIVLESVRLDREPAAALLLTAPETAGPLVDPSGAPLLDGLDTLAGRGFHIFRVRGYASGRLRIPPRLWDGFSHPDAYNRSNQLQAVQDILTALVSLSEASPGLPIQVVGLGDTGLIAGLAVAAWGGVERLVLDLNGLDPSYEAELRKALPIGSLGRVGEIRAAMLIQLGEGRLDLFHVGPTFEPAWYEERARQLGATLTVSQDIDYAFSSLTP